MKALRALLLIAVLLALNTTSVPAPARAAVSASANFDAYANVAVSSTDTYYSAVLDIRTLKYPSVDLYWTGTPTGTFTVQVSNKPNPVTSSDADWKTLTLATAISQPAGSASGDYVDLAPLPFRWLRLKYVNASGTGNIKAFVFAKE